jgi:hypothetical protein
VLVPAGIPGIWICGGSGFAVVLIGVSVSLVPPGDSTNKLGFELKLVGGTIASILLGSCALLARRSRQAGRAIRLRQSARAGTEFRHSRVTQCHFIELGFLNHGRLVAHALDPWWKSAPRRTQTPSQSETGEFDEKKVDRFVVGRIRKLCAGPEGATADPIAAYRCDARRLRN